MFTPLPLTNTAPAGTLPRRRRCSTASCSPTGRATHIMLLQRRRRHQLLRRQDDRAVITSARLLLALLLELLRAGDGAPRLVWYASSAGDDSCYCDDGSATMCKSMPTDGCGVDGYWVDITTASGSTPTTTSGAILLLYGVLKDCVDRCEVPQMQLAFIFDTSSSITEDDSSQVDSEVGEKNWDAVRTTFTAKVVEELPIGYDDVVVSYSSFDYDTDVRVSFTDPESANKNELLEVLLFDWITPSLAVRHTTARRWR
eukprot:scaffold71221_cov39-Prasinocladus_malaysianus.AAC.1